MSRILVASWTATSLAKQKAKIVSLQNNACRVARRRRKSASKLGWLASRLAPSDCKRLRFSGCESALSSGSSALLLLPIATTRLSWDAFALDGYTSRGVG